jgi:hypothetical protein
LFHEKLLNLRPCPSLLLSTKNGPISCVAPYPTEEHPGPTTTNHLVTLAETIYDISILNEIMTITKTKV